MRSLSIGEIARLCGGKYTGNNPERMCGEIVTDSRKLSENCVFVALKGERFDGHDYVDKALENGAAVAVVSDIDRFGNTGKSCEGNTGKSGETAISREIIIVPDTLIALGNLAAAYLAKYFPEMRRAAVTGSVGKTSTKEMCAAVLAAGFKTRKTPENFNNEIGLPMTVFGLDPDTELFVAEMGMRGLNQINYLARIVMPEAAVITNVGSAHLELLGTRENIRRAKMEIVTPGDPLTGEKPFILAVNGDNDLLSDREALLQLAKEYGRENLKIISFGMKPGNEFRATEAVGGSEGLNYLLICPEGNFQVHLHVPGEHNIFNSLAAICMGYAFGIPVKDAVEVLNRYGTEGGDQPLRQKQETLAGGRLTLMDDTYNAGPESMEASLKVLKSVPAAVHMAALADMLELGEKSPEFHRKTGKFAAECCEKLFFAGNFAGQYLEGAGKYSELSGKPVKAACFPDSTAAADAVCREISDELAAGNTVAILTKGSHAMHMERISRKIREIFG